LVVLGLAVVAFCIARAFHWAVIAGVGGALVASGVLLSSAVRGWHADEERPADLPADFSHLLDLLRRVHRARGGWIVGVREGDVEVADGTLDDRAKRRGAGIAQLAAMDTRIHVSREGDGTYVAVGSFPYAAALLLTGSVASPAATEAVADDLRRVVATLSRVEFDWAQGDRVARQLAALSTSGQSLELIAQAAARLAQEICGRPAAVLVQDPAKHSVRVLGLSASADVRLTGFVLRPDAPGARAIAGGVPVTTADGDDIFGVGVPERRRGERAGTAYPLFDGRLAVGALVLTGPPIDPDSPKAEQVGRLVVELGPRLASVRAVQEAEERAVKDVLTGLHNRRAFEQQLDRFRQDAPRTLDVATLIYVDIDHFKQLNDSLGHPAGDAALQHIARILEREIRDGDLVARIGGEEFAVWLPRTSLARGLEVAERIRGAVEQGGWRWESVPRPLTASCGVAAYPDSSSDVNNLRTLADAALYRAKQAGRNRVEIAGSGG
jgi:diguanylate cyclase (GGDEF)-like protein